MFWVINLIARGHGCPDPGEPPLRGPQRGPALCLHQKHLSRDLPARCALLTPDRCSGWKMSRSCCLQPLALLTSGIADSLNMQSEYDYDHGTNRDKGSDPAWGQAPNLSLEERLTSCFNAGNSTLPPAEKLLTLRVGRPWPCLRERQAFSCVPEYDMRTVPR